MIVRLREFHSDTLRGVPLKKSPVCPGLMPTPAWPREPRTTVSGEARLYNPFMLSLIKYIGKIEDRQKVS